LEVGLAVPTRISDGTLTVSGLQAMVGFLKVFGYPSNKTTIGWNITTERQQLISSLMTLGAFISSGFAGVAANKFGRRQCLGLACIICCIANIIMMTTKNIIALYIGRLTIGFANGYFMCFSQLYIQESSVAKYRGLFLTGFQFFTSFVSIYQNLAESND
jgi:MFS family permease